MRGLDPVIIGATMLGMMALTVLYLYSVRMVMAFSEWTPQRVAVYVSSYIAMNDKLLYETSTSIKHTEKGVFLLDTGDELKRPLPAVLDKAKIKSADWERILPVTPSYSYKVFIQEWDPQEKNGNGRFKTIAEATQGTFKAETVRDMVGTIRYAKYWIFNNEELEEANKAADAINKVIKNFKKILEGSYNEAEFSDIEIPRYFSVMTSFYPEYYVSAQDLLSSLAKEDRNAILNFCRKASEIYKETLANNKLRSASDVGFGYSAICGYRSYGVFIYPIVIAEDQSSGTSFKFGRIAVIVIPGPDKESLWKLAATWSTTLMDALKVTKMGGFANEKEGV